MQRLCKAAAPILITLLSSCLVGCAEPGTFIPSLDELREQARARHERFLENAGGISIRAETQKALPPMLLQGEKIGLPIQSFFSTEITRKGGRNKIETWSRDLPQSDFFVNGFIQLSGGDRANLLVLSTHKKNSLTWMVRGCFGYFSQPQTTKFQRWFDWPILAAAGTGIVGIELVEGRECYHLRFPVVQRNGRYVYQFNNISQYDAFKASLAEAGLEILELEIAGRRNPLHGPSLDSLPTTDGNIPRIDGAWVVEQPPRRFPVSISADLSSVSHGDYPVEGREANLFDTFGEVWIDKETLRLARIDGFRWEHMRPIPISLVWSDFVDIPGLGDALPRKTELYQNGEVFATSTVTSFNTGVELSDDVFDPQKVYEKAEISLQEKIESGLRDDISKQRLDYNIVRSIDESRDRVFHPDQVIDILDLKEGDVVADVGAGMGYFTFRLAQAVGPGGTVYAIDVVPEYVSLMKMRMQDPTLNPYDNIEYVVNSFDDIALPAESVDLVFMCDTHFQRFRYLSKNNASMVASIYRATRPGGRLVNIEKRIEPVDISLVSDGMGMFDLREVIPGFPSSDVGLSFDASLKQEGKKQKRQEEEESASGQNFFLEEKKSIPPSKGLLLGMRLLDDVKKENLEALGFEFTESYDLISTHDFFVFRKPLSPKPAHGR